MGRCGPAILCAVGPSGSGKTTWIEALIPRLLESGVSLSVVKTCHHDPQIEPDRKDSARHLEAGARSVLLLAPGKLARTRKRKVEDPGEIIREFADEEKTDLVLVEGGHFCLFPKVAVSLTGREWDKVSPFPLLAAAGEVSFREDAPDWTETESAVAGVKDWLSLRAACSGIIGAVLAGGRGARLGGVLKSELEKDRLTLGARGAALLSVFLSSVAFVSPRPEELAAAPPAAGRILRDREGHSGPLAGLLAALEVAEQGVFLMAVDQIGAPPGLVRAVLEKGLAGGAAVVEDESGLCPTLSFVSTKHRRRIEELADGGENSLHGVLEAVGAARVRAVSARTADVDEPEDMRRLGVTRGTT